MNPRPIFTILTSHIFISIQQQNMRNINMNENLKNQQIVKYGNDYTSYSNVRKFNAIDVLEKRSKYKNQIILENMSIEQYKLKQNMYSALGFEEKQQAIYFLYDKSELVYIGQTVRHNIYNRPMEHEKCGRSPKQYDFIKIMKIPKEICVDTLEALFILNKKPKYNKWNKIGGLPISQERIKKLKRARSIFNQIKIN